MAVSMTEAAARHVNRYLNKRGKGVGVRLGVKTTGCSGLAYKLEYVDELAPEDKLAVARARKIQRFLSQPFHVAEVFTGAPGKYVPLKETIKGFKGIVNGDYDHLPEQAFYMVGAIEEAVEKAKTL